MFAPSFYYTLVSESYSLFPYRYRYSFGNVCTLLLLNSCLRILLAVSVPVLLFHCLGTLFVLSLYSLFTLFVLSLYCRCTIVYYLRTSDIRYSLCTITVPVLSKCIGTVHCTLFAICVLSVHYLCTIVVLSSHFSSISLFYPRTLFAPELHYMCTIYLSMYCLCTITALHLYCGRTTCVLSKYYTVYRTCTPFAMSLYSRSTTSVLSLYYRCILFVLPLYSIPLLNYLFNTAALYL